MQWACGILLGATVKNRHILESNTCHMCVLTYPVFTHRSSNVCKDAAFSQDKIEGTGKQKHNIVFEIGYHTVF